MTKQADLFAYGDVARVPVDQVRSAPHNGVHTSRAAADLIKPSANRLRALVLDAIRKAGKLGATCDEVEDRLTLRHQTCSARFNELMKIRAIVDSGTTRKTRSGRAAIVWHVAS